MPNFSAEATKWGAIGAASCFAIFAALVGILFFSGKICSASYGDQTALGACEAQQSIDDQIKAITSEDEIRQLASAISANRDKSAAVAAGIHQKFPRLLQEVAGIAQSPADGTLFSLNDHALIDHLDGQLTQAGNGGGADRFAAMNRAIERVPLWSALRRDAERRTTIFRPVADRYEATQPSDPPAPCTIRTKSDGPFREGEMIYLESEDGARRIVREAISDQMRGARYQFHLNSDDARSLRLTVGSQTRGNVFARPAQSQERRDLYEPCIDQIAAAAQAVR